MTARLYLAALVLGLSGADAAACTILMPPPARGETLQQSVWRREAAYQHHLRQTVSHVYVARVVPTGRNFRFDPMVAVDGPRPPRWVFVPTHGSCDATPRTGEVRLVFAEHTDQEEFPGEPWNWGRMVVLHSVRLDQVADPELVAALAARGVTR